MISFIVIGGAWGSHQRMLNQIKRGDGLLVWFNLFCLLFVALLPASAALLGRYPNAFVAILFFAADVALIQLAVLWLWRHASRSGLVNPALDVRVVESIGRRLSLSTVIFILSIPLAIWNTWITYVFWIGFFLFLFATDWLSWQQSTRTQQTTFPLDDVRRGSVHVQHGIGILRIDSKAEDNVLLNGVFGGGLQSRVDRSEGAANIQLSVPERRGLLDMRYPWSWGPANMFDWALHLGGQIPLALEIETSEGQSTLELGALQITDLIRTKASSMEISLPDREGQTSVNIEVSSAYLTVHVPRDAAAAIHIHGEKDTSAAEIDLARFPMTEKDRDYRSADYEPAAKRLDIRIVAATGFVKIT